MSPLRAAARRRILLDFDGDRRDIADYEAAGGYVQLAAALRMEPGEIVAAVDASGLRGRGGAGFPTGRKASFLPKDRKPAYLCINADESEPGTFKDREIMLRNPHALIEGILTMSYAIGATAAFIYIRGEYRTEFEVLRSALEQARSRGFVGRNVLGSGYDATVVLHRGAGAYICGEETALLTSLEGERGQPRSKPPFPAVAGLYAAPTLVNNVETLASVPFILAMGGEAYAAIGTDRSKGTRVFSLSGNVRKPGNYELPLTATLRDLIEGCGGGAPEGRTIKAIIPGG
ncbi:MAG TPA: SLBB domain-containing protein, partial [Thermoleophilia bacterium]|nr:SLBB domain-containing protein [Thermoleophilia bacterium]